MGVHTSGVLNIVAGSGNSLSVGFHGKLLQVGGEAVHVLVEPEDSNQYTDAPEQHPSR